MRSAIEDTPAWFVWLTCSLFVAFTVVVDRNLGTEIGLELFYLVPVGILSWKSGAKSALAATLVTALGWIHADLQAMRFSTPLLLGNALLKVLFLAAFSIVIEQWKRALHKNESLARTDSLTGLGNWLALEQEGRTLFDRACKESRPLSIIYLDLDRFKTINDTLGHEIGSTVLRRIGAQISAILRPGEFAARPGGDEFLLMLSGTEREDAERLLHLQNAVLESVSDLGLRPTFSAGLFYMEKPAGGFDSALRESDRLMYASKQDGRARTTSRRL